MSKHSARFIYKLCLFLVCAALIDLGFNQKAVAQQSDISLTIQTQPVLNNAQILSLASLGIDRKARGQTVANMAIRNNNPEPAENLYFNVFVRSSRRGLLAEALQMPEQPFSMDPMQIITANNNLIQNGVPGISEELNFNSRLTSKGEEFINSLKGSTRLPNDIYTLRVVISQDNNIQNGGTILAESTVTIGGNAPTAETRDIFLRFPGDVLGQEFVISNTLPEFNWDGESNLNYRILVVRANGTDSPEALLQNARSTQPAIENGRQAKGSLLEFEHVDAIVDQPSFQMPPNGVQKFEPGDKYYWRVIAQIRGPGSTQEITSEIWQFRVLNKGSDRSATQDQLILEQLKTILGDELYSELQKQGFELESIKLNGKSYSGRSITPQLRNFINRINRGEITTVVNQ